MPGTGAPLASSDESPCMPASKLPYFCFSIWGLQTKQEKRQDGGGLGCWTDSNQDLMRQFILLVMYSVLSKPQDIEVGEMDRLMQHESRSWRSHLLPVSKYLLTINYCGSRSLFSAFDWQQPRPIPLPWPPQIVAQGLSCNWLLFSPSRESEHIISMTNYAGCLLPIWQAIKDIVVWLWMAFC